MNKDFVPLGVLVDKHETGILVQKSHGLSTKFFFSWSNDGSHFRPPTREVVIFLENGKKESSQSCSHFQFLKTIDGWIVSYIRQEKKESTLVLAQSLDLYIWHVKSTQPISGTSIALVSTVTKKTHFLIYSGGTFFRLMHSKDLKQWVRDPQLLLTSRADSFDYAPLHIIGGFSTKKGVLIIYDASHTDGSKTTLVAGAVLFSKTEPNKILWRSEVPLWKSLVESSTALFSLGVTHQKESLTIYWATAEEGIISIALSTPFEDESLGLIPEKLYLEKSDKNPIIEPRSDNHWENEAVFNPAAFYDNGKIHLLYRAIGHRGISVLGYASSKDGLSFKKRLDYPVYEPCNGVDLPNEEDDENHIYNPIMYTSGGGWGGCEDPRAVKIGNRIYVTYLAFGGWNSMRLALTSIRAKDLEEEKWNWTEPQYISPPGEVNKNWVLFPEKINRKFAILHSITPTIQVEYVSSLKEFDGTKFIKSHAPVGGRKGYWDSKVRGAGPPPLKTPLGWLVLYHANDSREPYKYKLGAMILDKNNPEKVLYRTSHPILSPNMYYENNGKPGIVYASGAVIKEGTLFVYYGGADHVVCVASAPLDELLDKIKNDVEFSLKPASTNTI